jgi:hypothetical protein
MKEHQLFSGNFEVEKTLRFHEGATFDGFMDF